MTTTIAFSKFGRLRYCYMFVYTGHGNWILLRYYYLLTSGFRTPSLLPRHNNHLYHTTTHHYLVTSTMHLGIIATLKITPFMQPYHSQTLSSVYSVDYRNTPIHPVYHEQVAAECQRSECIRFSASCTSDSCFLWHRVDRSHPHEIHQPLPRLW